MSRLLIIFAIATCYFIFAILLNSVGTVILQSINSFDISKPDASTLEGFKDLSIAIVSFFVASQIPRIGYKNALLFALLLVTVACVLTPIMENFLAVKILFACVGSAFAFIKVTVYSLVGQLSKDTRSHSALLNTIEGIFMVGMLSGYWIFGAFIDPDVPGLTSWMNVYYLLAAITFTTAVIVFFTPIATHSQNNTTDAQKHESEITAFVSMLKLTYQPLVLVFILSIFFYVLIEQGVGTWLPTFNREVLQLPVTLSIQMTSIFAAALALGRLLAGQLLKHIDWFVFLNVCLFLMATLILVSVPLTSNVVVGNANSVFNAPIAAYLLPMIGLLMAPIYPLLNSVMLSSLPRERHASMTGLIVVFSALGGTTGSILTGFIFEYMGGQHAFYASLVPMVAIACCLFIFKRISNNASEQTNSGKVSNER